MGEGEHQTTPLLVNPSATSCQSDGAPQRTEPKNFLGLIMRGVLMLFLSSFKGTAWTATAHIITAVIGSGVLSLAWSMSQLGWIAGPLAMMAFAGITVVSSFLLCDCYRPYGSENGLVRNSTYMDAVRCYLGKTSFGICAFIQQLSLYGTAVAYTITSSTSMRS